MYLKKYHIHIEDNLADLIEKEIFYSFPSRNLDNVYTKMIKNSYPPRWLQPVVQQVEKSLERTLHRYWLNIMPSNSRIRWHKHWKNPEVAVLYIKIPNENSSIEFDFEDKIITVNPYPGLLLRFPGTLNHRVLESDTGEHRISIAFDLL